MIPEELMEEYRRSIPERLQEIERVIQDVNADPTSQEKLAALRFAVHKLAGNSGTFGYMEASQLCRDLEQKILQKAALDLGLFYQQLKKSFHS
ncbi:MAG: Hpt domain-containing protein [Verrucomicrobia bacterium]|nr:Hpt domain-containing protein [Verrucomicrobiota bacterium]MBU6446510.1 Hpt domain-containing protein [Verrucomicrobiota bacterium]MDE3046841.1 Hpt domain-containing protein [Verrucomicrobiota bacterium]